VNSGAPTSWPETATLLPTHTIAEAPARTPSPTPAPRAEASPGSVAPTGAGSGAVGLWCAGAPGMDTYTMLDGEWSDVKDH